MTVYHMSDTLKLGDALTTDYKKTTELVMPFVQALEKGEDCFYAMVLSGKYLRAVLGKFGLRDMWSDPVKWSVEGAFEYVRRTEFPDSYCRIQSNYFFQNIAECKELYEVDWGKASEEERSKIRLYEMKLADDSPQRLDMRLFDEAYDAMYEHDDVKMVLDCARRYFAGEQSNEPVWEILSDKPARAVADITANLR